MYVCNVLCCFAVMCCVRTDDAMNKEWRDTATMEQRTTQVTEGMSESLEEGALGERVYIYSPLFITFPYNPFLFPFSSFLNHNLS